MRRLRKTWILLPPLALMVLAGSAQTRQTPKQEPPVPKKGVETPKKSAPPPPAKTAPKKSTPPKESASELAASKKPAEPPFRGVRYVSLSKRDPFLNPLLIKQRTLVDEEESRGSAPPGIAGMYIAQVALLGTSQREGTYTAVLRGTDKRAYFLRVGDRLFDGYVKTIEGDTVVLVRETKMKSGKVITQEVTKRLREP